MSGIKSTICALCRQPIRRISRPTSDLLSSRPQRLLQPPMISQTLPRFTNQRSISTSCRRLQQLEHSTSPQATLNLTPSAIKKLQSIRDSEKNPRVALRIIVESGGCHGYQYKMDVDEIPDSAIEYFQSGRAILDESEEFEDVDRLIGSPSQTSPADTLPYIIMDVLSLKLTKGSTIDYATELIGSSFRIDDNPQAKGAGCGCGVSWELKDDVL